MNTHDSKTSKNSTRAAANSIPVQQRVAKATVKIVDNRPKAVEQRNQPGSISPLAGAVIQRQVVQARIDGLTHLVEARNGSIFEGADFRQVENGTVLHIDTAQKLRSRRGPNQELNTEADRAGAQNNRWFKVLAVNGERVPDNVYVRSDTIVVEDGRAIAPSGPVGATRQRPAAGGGAHVMGGPVGGLSPADQRRWDALGRYTTLTVAAPEQAEISRNPAFNPAGHTAVALNYIQQFSIISRRQFENKINEIALGIMRVGQYSCIISEVGKSNFWLTGKVLDQVRRLGGRPPTRVISLPVKEKGDMDSRRAGEYAERLAGAGHIVFIDDGSYSGIQLFKFIDYVIGAAHAPDVPHSLGLVASTAHATHAVQSRFGTGLLAAPHPIGMFAGGNLNTAYGSMGLPLHNVSGEPPDGDALAGLHYKIPDYASVRHALLVGSSARPGPGPFRGYTQGRGGVPVRVHGRIQIAQRDGTEPYKTEAFLRAIAATRSLEELGIEDPTASAAASGAAAAAAPASMAAGEGMAFRGGMVPRGGMAPRGGMGLRAASSRARFAMAAKEEKDPRPAIRAAAAAAESTSSAAAAAAPAPSSAVSGGRPPIIRGRIPTFIAPTASLREDDAMAALPTAAAAAAASSTPSASRGGLPPRPHGRISFAPRPTAALREEDPTAAPPTAAAAAAAAVSIPSALRSGRPPRVRPAGGISFVPAAALGNVEEEASAAAAAQPTAATATAAVTPSSTTPL
jgi:hypothetical protein